VPNTDSSWTVHGTRLALNTCDPGPGAHAVTHRGKDAYMIAAVRAELVEGGAQRATQDHREQLVPLAWCMATRAVDESSVAELKAADDGNATALHAVLAHFSAAAAPCRT